MEKGNWQTVFHEFQWQAIFLRWLSSGSLLFTYTFILFNIMHMFHLWNAKVAALCERWRPSSLYSFSNSLTSFVSTYFYKVFLWVVS